MPTLCNMRTNLPKLNVPFKSKTPYITLGCMLPETHLTHTSFPFALWHGVLLVVLLIPIEFVIPSLGGGLIKPLRNSKPDITVTVFGHHRRVLHWQSP
eukprot:1161390-Pelagomonas_calceolata.AAC.2